MGVLKSAAFFNQVVRSVAPRRYRKPVQHEKTVQAAGVQLLKTLGAEVYVLGTRRPAGKPCSKCGTFVAEHQGTRQTPGISDVLAFLPHAPARPGPHVQLWWEAKRPEGGRASPAQRAFRDHCVNANVAHVLGDGDALISWLLLHGYLRANQVPHYRLPPANACS